MRRSLNTIGRVLGIGIIALAPLCHGSIADAAERRHGLSTFGELKYQPGFKHFDYVNPQAPKGGRLSKIGGLAIGPFNTFNSFILKGDPAQGMGLIYDSLMARALDEPDSMYGLVAHSVEVADDKKSVTFFLRPEARFADGRPLTAEDVVFTLTILKEKGHPFYRITLRDVVKVVALDPLTVRFEFTGTRTRDLPMIVAGLAILSKKYYDTQPFEETTLKPPVGSGPYKVGPFESGKYVTYVRREDYWAKDLPIAKGQWNFNEIRLDYYQNRSVELQALISGLLDFREEFTSRDWATAYDVPAVKQSRLLRYEQPDNTPSATQGLFINTRREKFKDVRVRKALELVFDFEWMNRNLFFSNYTRTESYFENSDMKAHGLPTPEELKLLEPFRDRLPKEVFEEPYRPAVNDGFSLSRDNLRRASDLLEAAGWKLIDGRRTKTINGKTEVLAIEFMIESLTSERITVPFQKNLQALGIEARIRQVDAAQYENRIKSFDFDILGRRYSLSLTPGPELKNYWGTEAGKMAGGSNLAGIADPVVDALIDKIAEAKSRAELYATCRALDRVLRAGHYWIPNWFKGSHWFAHWDRYQRPAVVPRFDTRHSSVLSTWWFDNDKAQRLKETN